MPVLSFLVLDAIDDTGSSRDNLDDDPTDPPGEPEYAAEVDRCTALGKAMFRDLGLVLGNEVRLALFAGSRYRSATLFVGCPRPNPATPAVAGPTMPAFGTLEGGERGRLVRMGKLPGEDDMLSRAAFRARVGVNSSPGPELSDKIREDSRASTVSSSKWGSWR